MIGPDKRKAIYLLHEEGMSLREISRRLNVSRHTVNAVIAQGGAMPKREHSSKVTVDPELLQRLYNQCDGWIQRIHEKLGEEEGILVKYSTLTRLLRNSGIGKVPENRCGQVPDAPGQEMQHDTTTYPVKLGEHTVKVVASLLYLRYSKRRYLRFYRTFNRFNMKCFIHEALMHWGYAPRQCVIDNTNLARLRGTGANAVIVPEMEAFAKEYGFRFLCHALGHPDRKAGEERSFWTVETNFLPGRSFLTLEEMNQQAFEWACVRLEHRPQGRNKLIPAKAFEQEQPYLNKLHPHLPAPYKIHKRGTDAYGYAAFESNFFWVPGTGREDVVLLQFSDTLKIYRSRELLIQYPLPIHDSYNRKFDPPDRPPSGHQPNNRKHPTDEEEKRLRALAPEVSSYLDFVLEIKGLQRHTFLRRLLALSRQMSSPLFIKSVERALRYRISEIETIERIAVLFFKESSLPSVDVNEEFQTRKSYMEGASTDVPDLSIYDIEDEPSEQT
jgi:transposase